jgi:hypothetical protein
MARTGGRAAPYPLSRFIVWCETARVTAGRLISRPMWNASTVTPSRIAENFDVFDFDLTDDQLTAIDALDTGERGGPEPQSITRESFALQVPEA